MTACLSGCASITQDVHRYYRQMAINYKEAEDKAKMDAMTLEGESRSLLQAGDLHGYNKAQKELARIKNWQANCARQRERFEKAAQKLEGPADPKKAADPGNGTASGGSLSDGCLLRQFGTRGRCETVEPARTMEHSIVILSLDSRLMRRFIILIISDAVVGAFLLGSAGRWDLPWFWAFIVVHLVLLLSMVGSLDRGLIRERRRPAPGGKDRGLRFLLTPFLLAQLIVAGLDAGRFGWSGPLPLAVHAVGLFCYEAAGQRHTPSFDGGHMGLNERLDSRAQLPTTRSIHRCGSSISSGSGSVSGLVQIVLNRSIPTRSTTWSTNALPRVYWLSLASTPSSARSSR